MAKRKRSSSSPSTAVKRESLGEHSVRTNNQNGSWLVTLLTHRDEHPRVSDLLLDYLDFTDIISLTQVSKALSTIYPDLLLQQWDINAWVGRHVSDAKDFRRTRGRNNALIVGSLPLQFFSRVYWEGSSLDILVQEGQESDAIVSYIRKEGYSTPKESSNYIGLLAYECLVSYVLE